MKKRRFTLSWRVKLTLLLLVFSILPVLITASYDYAVLSQSYESSTIQSLDALSKAKADAIDQFTDIRKRDVERIATLVAPQVQDVETARTHVETAPLPDLKDAEELPQAPPGSAKPPPPSTPPPPPSNQPSAPTSDDDLRKTLRLILWDQKEFEELLIMDNKGSVVASTFTDHEGHDASALEYFVQGRKATFVQPVFLSPITNELTMIISGPILDTNGSVMGVLAARLNLARFFDLINDTTGLGTTGEVVVAKLIDQQLVFMAPTRHDANAALEKFPASNPHPTPMQEATRGSSGSGLELDYRGMMTFAAWRHVRSLDWGLVVKIDRDEALKPVNTARERTVLIASVIVLLAFPVSLLAAGALVAPLRKLKAATDRISRGDFAVELDIHTSDEIGQLADSFERMVAAIKFFRERSQRSTDADSDVDADAQAQAEAEAKLAAGSDPKQS